MLLYFVSYNGRCDRRKLVFQFTVNLYLSALGVRMLILHYLASNGIVKDDQQLKNKIDISEKSYRSARSMLSTARDRNTISDGGTSIRDKVLELYPL